MHLYHVKQDGYILGVVRGKHSGYKYIEKVLKLNRIQKQEVKWEDDKCNVTGRNIIYTIERA